MKTYRRPYRIKRKKSILKNRFFWLFILIFIIAGGFFYLLFLSSFFQIKEIKISGNQKVLAQDLENLVESQIAKKIAFFTTKSIFLINSKKINNIILGDFPQIEKVKFKKDFPDTLDISVEERKPVAIFYQNDNYFLIDKNGIVFEKVSESTSTNLKIENKILSSEIKVGEKAVEENLLAQIIDIENKFKEDIKIPLQEFCDSFRTKIKRKNRRGLGSLF